MKTATAKSKETFHVSEAHPVKPVSKVERNACLSKMKRNWKKGSTSVSIWSTRHQWHTGPCHASFPRTVSKQRQPHLTPRAALCDTGIQRRPQKDKSLYEPFLKWLLNESFYAPFYENRDNFEECRDVGILVNLTGPSYALTFAAVVVTRIFWEGSTDSFKAFNSLVDKGIPGDIAYITCILSSVSSRSAPSGQSTSSNVDWQWTPRLGHTSIIVNTLEDFKRTLKGEFFRQLKATYGGPDRVLIGDGLDMATKASTLGSYALATKGAAEHWYTTLLKESKELREILAAHRKGGTGIEEPTIPDPFKPVPLGRSKPVTDPLHVSFKEAVEVLVPAAYELGLFE